jgi:hypothetical protein
LLLMVLLQLPVDEFPVSSQLLCLVCQHAKLQLKQMQV